MKKNFLLLYFFISTLLILFLGIYENKSLIKKLLNKFSSKEKITEVALNKNENSSKTNNNKLIQNPDFYWSDQIKKGGYIIFLRHTKRNRFGNVRAFDGLEMTQQLRGEDTYFSERVCLNKQGKEDAKMIGDYFRLHNIKANFIVTSKSCRARQTARLIFERIDEENNLFIFLSIFKENNGEMFNYREKIIEPKIIEYLTTLEKDTNRNIFIVAHGGILHPTLFSNEVSQSDLEMDEGGFVIIEAIENKLFYKYKFNRFDIFSSTLNTHSLN